jgi:hypothetical protein
MPQLQVTTVGIRELYENVGPQMYRDAKTHNRSLSQWLDVLNPTEGGDRGELDAFGRLMKESGIVSRSIPELGIYADTFEAFNQNDQVRALFPEWCFRVARRAKESPRTRAMTSLDSVVGSSLRPYADDSVLRQDGFRPAIPLSEVIANSRGIQGNVFRSTYLTEPAAAAKRMSRVAEAANIPVIQVMVGQRAINLYKYGRGVEFTYEVMRRESLDRVATIVELVSVQNEVDKVATVLDVMVNGDGNAGTAATSYNLTALDSATTAQNLTLNAWIAFKLLWRNPYQMTTILAESGPMAKRLVLNTGSQNQAVTVLPPGIVEPLTPIEDRLSDGIRYGITDDAPSDKIIGFDRRAAVERVFEIGADIEETERYIRRQTEAIFFTEVEGYQVMKQTATKILNLAA